MQTRKIEDFEIEDMIRFYQTANMGLVIAHNTIAMLRELKERRESEQLTTQEPGD